MSVVKSYSVGVGDTFYIQHNSDNFTIIDCCLSDDNADDIIGDLKRARKGKGISRFISTHPDDDHFRGLELLDAALPISNFYVVKNNASKENDSPSWDRYCELRDDAQKAFYLSKGCTRKWMNLEDQTRRMSGIDVLWPDTNNEKFREVLKTAERDGSGANNVSAVIRYSVEGGASFMWLGDLETAFMESIAENITLQKTTVVFASHHGRTSGKLPDSWLKKLDPQIIVIGEAPSRHLHYYSGYDTVTQNMAGDIVMEAAADKLHFFVGNESYECNSLRKDQKVKQNSYSGLTYIGSLAVETKYTL